ncbi:MAG: hypothetical protein ACRCTP_17870 [Aeromonas popoffii]|uniref:hypothetical protein n=1 Tax=Aeromonas popoffii TaxID=70856 RepID=UPI003F2D6033
MELELISNDHDRFIYIEGHVSLSLFHVAVREDGYTTKGPVRHTFLVEKPVPDHHRDEFTRWYVFCDEDEPGAFPVTCATV